MEEMNHKDMKKLLKWQQFILDMAFAMQDLTKDMEGQKIFIEPMKKHSAEMYANAKTLQKVTGQELQATDKEARDGRKTIKYFSLRRLFSVMSGTIKEDARYHEIYVKNYPAIKTVIDSERRIAESVKRLEERAKKQKEIHKKLGLK